MASKSVGSRCSAPKRPAVYWRDAARVGEAEILWRAENDFGFCIERSRDLLQRLEDGGWSCRRVDATPRHRIIPAIALRGADASADRLDAALARDLARLAELTRANGGRFEVEGARLGDLDHDGVPDAAAIFTFGADAAGRAPFLIAYRFDGETFRPAARTYLGGHGVAVPPGAIERVGNGIVEVVRYVRAPGDPACCPSKRTVQVYRLQDRALLPVSTRPGN